MLAVASAKPMAEQCGKVCEEHPGVVDELPVLGVVIDETLSWRPQLRQCLAKLHNVCESVVGAMDAAGFGLPFQTSQYASRIEKRRSILC